MHMAPVEVLDSAQDQRKEEERNRLKSAQNAKIEDVSEIDFKNSSDVCKNIITVLLGVYFTP